MEYAHSKSAIIVMPNYRLAPASKELDILEDLSDFWKWVASDLQAFISGREGGEKLEIDLSKIWVHGESAGTQNPNQSYECHDVEKFPLTASRWISFRSVWLDTTTGHRQGHQLRFPVARFEGSLVHRGIRERLLSSRSSPRVAYR